MTGWFASSRAQKFSWDSNIFHIQFCFLFIPIPQDWDWASPLLNHEKLENLMALKILYSHLLPRNWRSFAICERIQQRFFSDYFTRKESYFLVKYPKTPETVKYVFYLDCLILSKDTACCVCPILFPSKLLKDFERALLTDSLVTPRGSCLWKVSMWRKWKEGCDTSHL